MSRTLLFNLLLAILLSSCNQQSNPAVLPAESSQAAPEKPMLVDNQGNTIAIGTPIPAIEKEFPPDRGTRIISVKGKTKTFPAHPNVHPAGTPKVMRIPDSLISITPGKDSVPLPEKIQVEARKRPDLYATSIPALPPDYKDAATANIQYLSGKHGLNHVNIYALLKDSRGHIWFGGDGGVSRYDGTHFENFPLGTVWSIYEDRQGILWFGTNGNGVIRYDGDNFFSFNNEVLTKTNVVAITEGDQERLWFGTYSNGLICYEPDNQRKTNGTFTHFTRKGGLVGKKILSILEDSQGYLWLGTDIGLSRFKPDETGLNGRFTHFTARDGMFGQVSSILEDEQKNLWLGTGNGVFFYHPEPGDGIHGHLTQFTPKEGLNGKWVWSMQLDKEGKLWIGTVDGLSRYDPIGKTFTHYTIAEGLSSNMVWSVLDDGQGTIWTGLTGSVSRLNKSAFTYYSTNEGLIENTIRSSLEDSRGNLWFGTLKGGVTRYEPAADGAGSANFIQYLKEPGLLVPAVRNILEDSRGNIWFGTPSNLNRFHPSDEAEFIGYKWADYNLYPLLEDRRGHIWLRFGDGVGRYIPGEGGIGEKFTQFIGLDSTRNNRALAMFENGRGNIWIGTLGNGVIRYVPNPDSEDEKNGRFTYFTTSEGLAGNEVRHMLEDRWGNVWFGTNRGVCRLARSATESSKVKDQFTHFTSPEALNGKRITGMAMDSLGNIWFGTRDNELSCYVPDPQSRDGTDGKFVLFSGKEGFIGGNLRRIIVDRENNVWTNTVGEINLLTPHSGKVDHPSDNDYQLFSFDKINGLKHSLGPGLLDSKSRIWWGFQEGLTMLDLNELKLSTEPPASVSLNTVEVKGASVDYRRLADTAYRRQLVFGEELARSFDSVAAFFNYPVNWSLPHHLGHLTFHFSAVDWAAPQHIKYSFLMEGSNDDWSLPNTDNKAEYRNLRPGKYIFKLKASGMAHTWSKVFEYHFQIRPPWWFTWQAYLSYGLLAALLLYLAYRFLLNRRLALAETERRRELDAFKIRLFTNITHEFRTPLTIILGMVRQIKDNPKKWYSEGLEMIGRNGRQLLSLVNQMLDLSKLDKGKLELKMQQGEIVGFLHYLIQSFDSLAAGKNIQLHFLKEIDRLGMDFDPKQLTKVVSNLLSNAVKYTPEGGQVYVTVRQQTSIQNQASSPHQTSKALETFEVLELRVKDTGQGISPEDLPHIFDRFYQADSSATRKGEGTGIGLALTKELVQLMGGKIQVQSKPGEGSDFSVKLPIAHSAPKAEPALTTIDIPDLETIVPEGMISASSGKPDAERSSKTLGVASEKDLPVALLIEDNRDVLTYLASCLEADYQLEFAQNGQEGIDQALEIVPDIIISDVMMPEKDGYEVCATLKQDIRTSHIPIILLTAKADQDSRITGLKSGADAYLAKPFDKEELHVRLEKLLALRRQLQARYGDLNVVAEVEEKSMSKEDLFLKALRTIIEENLSDESFGIAQLCRKIGMSRSQLHNKLKALTGKSASIYIRAIRLEKAKALLRKTDMNVSEVAYEVGFRTSTYFTQVFKEEVGMAPSQFRV